MDGSARKSASASCCPIRHFDRWDYRIRTLGRRVFFAGPEALRGRSFHRFRYLRFFISRNLQALLRQGKDDSVLVVRKGRKDAREEYQHAGWCERLKGAWIAHGMSRMGNFIGNGATEQVFGHVKDEFF